LAKAPEPASAAGLSTAQLSAALERAGRRKSAERAAVLRAALRTPHLGRSQVLTAAYAATIRARVAILTTLTAQITALEGQIEAHVSRHPEAEIYRSQPGLGPVLGARVLAEFGDDPLRYADVKARRNYTATSPITRASGKKKTVMARWVHNDRLSDALSRPAFAALGASPGARAYSERLRAREVGHWAALRQLANRLVGILHGCLKTGTLYDETTAWSHRSERVAA
jgi:transposase